MLHDQFLMDLRLVILHDERVLCGARDTRCVLINHFGCIVSVNWNLRQSNIDWQAERIIF